MVDHKGEVFGYPDLYVLGGGAVADALYINNRDGTFSDRADIWGLGVPHRDFGELVYSGQSEHEGVLYIRFPAPARQVMIRTVVEHRKRRERHNPRSD